MHLDRGPLSAAYVSSDGRAWSGASRVKVHRDGVAIARGTLTFADGTKAAFDSLELPVRALDADATGMVLVAIASEEVNGPLVVLREGQGQIEMGFPFFDWEARCLDESYVNLAQPLYSRLPVKYDVVPFRARAALLQVAGAVRKLGGRRQEVPGVLFPEYPVCGVLDRVRNVLIGTHPSSTLVLTHDVDELAARPGIEHLRAVERRHGMRSAWGILSEKYRLPASDVTSLVAEGCEIFSHGYLHDGRLPYLPRAEQLMRLRHFFTAYPMLRGRTRGFRSGQLARSSSLYAAVQQVFDYDMTPPTTERGGPYGARSGVSTVFPFWASSGLLHLPLTLPQDYFLAFVENLDARAIAQRWIDATEQVLALGGLAVHLVHPDNVLRKPTLLDAYDRFLGWAGAKKLDVRLPGEVAASLAAQARCSSHAAPASHP